MGQALRRAFAYLGPHRINPIIALVAVLVVAVANLVTPQLIRIAIDNGIAPRNGQVIVWTVVGVFVVSIVRGAATFVQGFLAERGSQAVAYDLRNDFFGKVERLSFSYHDHMPTGQLLTRATSDIDQVRFLIGNGFINLVSSFLQIVAILILLFVVNWHLALITLVAVIAIVGVLLRFGSTIGPLFLKIQGSLSALNSILQEDLVGLRTIRAFRGEHREIERYRGNNETMFGFNLDLVRTFSANFRLIFLFASLGSIAVIYAGGRQVIGGDLKLGALIAYYSYLNYLIGPILTMGFLGSAVPRAGASAQRIFSVLDEPVAITDRPDAIALPPVRGEVVFDDVSFRFSGADHDVLHGVSFTARPGMTVAIIGTTGSGKSTLVNLIPRFYDVTGGAVRIDGHDVRDVTLDSLRAQVAPVLQESRLFSGTVRENISYGRPEASMDEIRAAAAAAQAAQFIDAMPDSYETIIGERGVGLSGGQRQRVAIARALLADRPILILDDSTSAVDATTEAEIRAAIDRLLAERRQTTFVIAQRVSTVQSANTILVMDAGRIVDQGTHDELLERSELYVSILGSQLDADSAFAPDETVVDEVAGQAPLPDARPAAAATRGGAGKE